MDIHIFVVDDDDLFRESVMQNLADSGFSVAGFSNGASMLSALRSNGDPSIILLDWKMPGLTGIEVLRRLREKDRAVPVIFLTVLGDQIYEEAALHGGAVDFVEKSRSFSILLKRIEVALSGAKSVKKDLDVARAARGPVELMLDVKRVFWKGGKVDLSLTEFHIVWHMVERAGRDVSYRDLYDIVHGEGFIGGQGEIGYRANVRAFIKRIRQKFRDVDAEFDQIENYPGFGYRWRDDAA